MFLDKDGENGTECRKLQCRLLFIEFCREEVNIVLAGRGFLALPQQLKLRHWFVNDNNKG